MSKRKTNHEKLQDDIARVFRLQHDFERWREIFDRYSATETLGIRLHGMSDEALQQRLQDAEKLWSILDDVSQRLRQQIHDGQASFTAEFTGFLAKLIAYLPTLALEQQALERTLTNRRLYGHTRWLDGNHSSGLE